jgi:hypothetical protein
MDGYKELPERWAYCGCNRNHAVRRYFGKQGKETGNGRQGR